MARKQAVTRMVKGTRAIYSRFNLQTMELEQGQEMVIPAVVGRTTEAVTKYLEKAYKEAVSHKFLMLERIEKYDVLLGMKLEDFIKYAVPLDENRRFPDGTEVDADDVNESTDDNIKG